MVKACRLTMKPEAMVSNRRTIVLFSAIGLVDHAALR
jgi:hypothetical protein